MSFRRAPFLLAALALAACGESSYDKPVQELVGSTMGTTFSVKIVDPPTNLDLVALQLGEFNVLPTKTQKTPILTCLLNLLDNCLT